MIEWSCLLGIEIVVLIIWHSLVYKKKNVRSQSLFSFFWKLTDYYLFIFKYRIHIVQKNCDMDEFLQKNSILRYELIRDIGFLGMLLIFLPGFAIYLRSVPFFPLMNMLTKNILIYIAMLSVLVRIFNEYRIGLAKLINEGWKFLYQFGLIKKRLKNKTGLIMKKKKSSSVHTLNFSNIIPAVLFILWSDLILIFILKNMLCRGIDSMFRLKDSIYLMPEFYAKGLVWVILFFVYKVTDKEAMLRLRQWAQYRNHLKHKSKIEVKYTLELEEIVPEILEMCALLNIKEITIGVDDLKTRKVISQTESGKMPVIVIDKKLFEKLQFEYPSEYWELIRLLAAHELIHIYYKDKTYIMKIYVILLLWFIAALGVFYLLCLLNSFVFFIIGILKTTVEYYVIHILRDKRYWNQVMEFRADRVGMMISNTSPEILENVLICIEEDDDEIKQDNFLHKIYKNTMEQYIHPSAEQRINEVRRGIPWGPGEYVRYLWIIGKNVLIGKGWRI